MAGAAPLQQSFSVMTRPTSKGWDCSGKTWLVERSEGGDSAELPCLVKGTFDAFTDCGFRATVFRAYAAMWPRRGLQDVADEWLL